MNALLTFFIVLYAIVCVLLILLVIVQGGRAEGLFASAQANVLGSRGADMLTKITRGLSAIFIVGALLISIFISSQSSALDAPVSAPATMSAPVETTTAALQATVPSAIVEETAPVAEASESTAEATPAQN